MADVQQGGTPTLRALASYWVVSALIIGAAAGIPWAWMLYGLLPSAVFAVTAGLYSLIQWRAVRRAVRTRPIRTTMVALAVGGAVGAIVASTLGRAGSYTWFDAAARTCFRLEGEPVPFFGRDLSGEMNTLLAIAGFVTFGSVAAWLRARASWWAWARHEQDASIQLWGRGAMACLAASLAWSLANETIGANFFDQRRDVCNPEIGWIALAGYAIAATGFGLALSRVRRLAPKDEPTRVRAMGWGGALIASLALLGAQTVRSASLVTGQTAWACGCLKSGGAAVRGDTP